MWQRIQTVFMGIVALSLIVFPFFTIWQKVNLQTGEVATLKANFLIYSKSGEILSETLTIYTWIAAWAAALLSCYSIVLYNNRLRQIQLNFVSTLLIGLVLGLNVYFMLFKAEVLFSNPPQGKMSLGFFLPINALIFNSLANRFIHRDEKLVRSADRLR